jgi:glycerate dehydrogenase
MGFSMGASAKGSAVTATRIVFLDRGSIEAQLRVPGFAHEWVDHRSTPASEVVARLAEARIAVTNKVPIREVELAQLPDLRMIAVAATGTDVIDIEACRKRGVIVSNIRNYAGSTVPEHVMAMILALRRNIFAYRASIESGAWQRASNFALLDHDIHELSGSRLGLVGYGTLAKAVARLGSAFGMEVCVFNRSPIDAPGVRQIALDELLATSDVLSLHVPLTPQTRGLIGARELSLMKPGALLINTARGGLVDEAALAQALREGRIGGAGIDVVDGEPPRLDNPLLDLRLPNFMLTPHVAWASKEAMQRLADQLIGNIEAFASGAPRNTVVA